MSKYDFEVAVAFATQAGEGEANYEATLDGITTSLSGDIDGTDEGLVLGDSGSGIRESGLSLGFARSRRDKAFLGATLTRSISDFLKADVPTFDFAFPFGGNKSLATATPVDADATPLVGINALLEGAGLVGAASVSDPTVGWKYVFGSPNPISGLVYVSGMRLELSDCRVVTLAIDYTPGGIAVATATIAVGSIKDQSLAALPTTLDYGLQASVSNPVVDSIAHQWQDTRGFSAGKLTINNTIDDIPDSNAADGIVKEKSDREVTFEGTLFGDDSTDKGYEYSQLIESVEGNLDQLSFTVGSAMVDDTTRQLAHQIQIPLPELQTQDVNALGTKAGYDVSVIARGAAAGSGNDELEVIFL